MTSPADALRGSGDPEIERLLDQFDADVAQVERLRDQITEVRGRGEAADGRVVAETSSTGELVGLTIDPRAMRLGSDELAAAVLEAAGAAARNTAEGMTDLVDPFIADTMLDMGQTPGRRPRNER
ncbi:YbaB/EbfC family nucleoid-associated protein [Nonomuraea sp. NPDC026600]|uniref:YbaB/EbfC family nucleoid-associated protein n=1 Tax=Nonomuraea sp. NPDC026600 TaxID=3155363 RepID=UPI0033F89957